MATPHRIVNGQVDWEGKTKAAVENARDQHLNRLFEDSNWEPIVIPFPRGIMIGFLNWAGNWESYTYWYHQTPAQRRWHGCTIDSERDKKKVLIGLHRHVAALVRDTDGSEAGLEYLWHEDHEGKEDYLQMSHWLEVYKAARAEGKGEEAARDIANEARAEFANRPEREPVRSLEGALAALTLGLPVPVSQYVWRELRDTSTVTQSGQFLWLRQGQFHWGYNPDARTAAWINSDLVAGYGETNRYYLLQLQADDWVIPAQKTVLSAASLRQAQPGDLKPDL